MVDPSVARLMHLGKRPRRFSLAWNEIPPEDLFPSARGNGKGEFMSRQMLLTIGILILTFGSGVGMGLYLGSSGSSASTTSQGNSATTSNNSATPGPEAQNDVHANTLLSDRIRDLEKELAEQKKDQAGAVADRMAFFKKYRKQIRVTPFDQTLGVTPEMAELLGISKEQQQTVEQHLEQVKGEMDKLEDGNTTVTNQTANSISFAIPADPKGKVIKDELTGLLTADIGEQQADLFMNSDVSSFAQQFGGFAETKKEIEITWTKQNNSTLYMVRNNAFTSDGHLSGSWSLSSNTLQPEYQKYMPADPAFGP